MKINRILTLLAVMSLAASCYDDGSDYVDRQTRVSLYPAPVVFQADGTTPDGDDTFLSVVTINEGQSRSDQTWTAEITNASWATVNETTVTSYYEQTGGVMHEINEKGIQIEVEPNEAYKRTFDLKITTSDKTVKLFTFTQLGELADAAVTPSVDALEFLAAGQTLNLTYETNMGNLYAYDIKYKGTSSSWLTLKDNGVGNLDITAALWTDEDNVREAELTITVGSEQTSLASATVSIVQNANFTNYYVFGAGTGLEASKAVKMERVAKDNYKAKVYFKNSADRKNQVLLAINEAAQTYPCLALAADGTIATISNASAVVPQGPAIDVDGLRTLAIDVANKKWTLDRVSTSNAMPDSELANYPTKEYVTANGTTKTWMTVGLHWNGGPTIGIYKLGSGLVSGHQTGGYSSSPYASRNPAYDTEENGGGIKEVVSADGKTLGELYGRLYSSYESMTGDPNGALNDVQTSGTSVLMNSPIGEPGETIIDAVGDSYVLESILSATLAAYSKDEAGNAKAEQEHPNVKMQIQGICPYGWHIANMQDWKDLAYAAYAAGVTDKPVPAEAASYGAFGSGTLTNFASILVSADWNVYNPEHKLDPSAGAAEFGFNMFSNGWRLYKTGYDYGPGDDNPRMYEFIPLIGQYTAAKKAGWRIWNQACEANMRSNDGFDFGNGCGGAIRCVKNYKQ